MKFDQYLQGELPIDVIVATIEDIRKANPTIDRAKLIVTATKKLKGKTNAAQIAKIIKMKGYYK